MHEGADTVKWWLRQQTVQLLRAGAIGWAGAFVLGLLGCHHSAGQQCVGALVCPGN